MGATKANKDKRQILLNLLRSNGLKHLVQRLASPDTRQSSARTPLIFFIQVQEKRVHIWASLVAEWRAKGWHGRGKKNCSLLKNNSLTSFLLTSRALKSSGKLRNLQLHACSKALLKQGTTVCPRVLLSSGYLCIRAWFANDFPAIFLSISSLTQNTFINPLPSRAPSPERKDHRWKTLEHGTETSPITPQLHSPDSVPTSSMQGIPLDSFTCVLGHPFCVIVDTLPQIPSWLWYFLPHHAP